ncbi:glycosyltransferase [Alteromonas sp. P256]|uniref:glycosyltransferase n=1 Tax=Alteromonas sp. P256 TaxID=3117399 RepID=UPI002FE28E91
MKKKNILFVHSSSSLAGGERVSELLFKGLKQHKRFGLYLLHAPENTEFNSLAAYYGVTPCAFEFNDLVIKNCLKTLLSTIKLVSLFKKNNIDIIHTVDPVAYRATAIAGSICNVKIIFHHHFPYSEDALRWFFKHLKKPECHVFCCESISQPSRAGLADFYSNVPIEIIHNSIDLNQFTFTPKTLDGTHHIGIVGNFQERKGHEDFIQIAKALIAKGYHCVFDVFGKEESGSGREKVLRDTISNAGLTDHFVFHGFVDNPADALESLHILVCTSKKEAFPMNILEAMAKGVSIISTDVDGIPESVVDNITGLLNAVGDVDKAVSNIVRLIDEREFRDQLLANARRSIEDNFTLDVFVNKFITQYDKLLTGNE